MDDLGGEGVGFALVEVEEEFVVNLEEHFGLGVLFGEEFGGVDHGELDHVGGGALDGGVDGGSLGVGADGAVAGVDVGEVAAAAADGFGVAVCFGRLDGVVHEVFDFGVLLPVGGDDFGGFGAGDGEALAEAEGGDAVDNAEVDHLGGAALVGGDLVAGEAVDFGGGLGVDVGVVLEGGDHAFVAGEGGHDAELDLGVVGGEEGEGGGLLDGIFLTQRHRVRRGGRRVLIFYFGF